MTALDTQLPITGEHRCDRCGAQAKIRASFVNGELYFCGHHARETANTLVPKALHVYDPESVINYGK
jgi:ribosomal protein S14